MGLVKHKAGQRFDTVRPIYRVADLAKVAGLSTRHLTSVLRHNGVKVHKTGQHGDPGLVYLVELREGMPEMWQSLLLARAVTI